MNNYPQNVIDELVKINDEGMTIEDQCEHIGWSKWHIRKARKELGLTTPDKYRAENRSHELQKILELKEGLKI